MTRSILAGVVLAACSTIALADTVDIPLADSMGLEMPRRGLSMNAVEERYGSPAQVLAAIGDPPITRWVYPDFTVYFEHDLVIHPVPRTRHTDHAN